MAGKPESEFLRRRRVELQEQVGRKVKQLREGPDPKQPRLRQEDLSGRLVKLLSQREPNVEYRGSLAHEKVISEIESGKRLLGLETIELLAEALQVHPLVLVDPAFRQLPRDALEVAEDQRRRFADDMNGVYQRLRRDISKVFENSENFDKALGRRAVLAIGQIGATTDDLETVVLMLEGLLRVRIEGQARAIAGTRSDITSSLLGDLAPYADGVILGMLANWNQLASHVEPTQHIPESQQ